MIFHDAPLTDNKGELASNSKVKGRAEATARLASRLGRKITWTSSLSLSLSLTFWPRLRVEVREILYTFLPTSFTLIEPSIRNLASSQVLYSRSRTTCRLPCHPSKIPLQASVEPVTVAAARNSNVDGLIRTQIHSLSKSKCKPHVFVVLKRAPVAAMAQQSVLVDLPLPLPLLLLLLNLPLLRNRRGREE